MSDREKRTLSIDFDGTICDWAFPECGNLKEGVKEAIDNLKKKYTIIISSCRTSLMFRDQPDNGSTIQKMVDYLNLHEIYYDRIDMGDEGKVVAIAYIDDRAVEFKDNWPEITKRLL